MIQKMQSTTRVFEDECVFIKRKASRGDEEYTEIIY